MVVSLMDHAHQHGLGQQQGSQKSFKETLTQKMNHSSSRISIVAQSQGDGAVGQ